MKDYIRIKKRTLWLALAILLCLITGRMIWEYGRMLWSRKKPPAIVEQRSVNVLQMQGKPLLYYSSITPDSTFGSADTQEHGILFADSFSAGHQTLLYIVNKSVQQLENDIDILREELDEINYWLGVHRVQDEGYNMIAQYALKVSSKIKNKEHMLQLLDSIPDNAKLTTAFRKTCLDEDSIKMTDVFAAYKGGVWKYGHWMKRPREGRGIGYVADGKFVKGTWSADTLQSGTFSDSTGTYCGEFNRFGSFSYHGSFLSADGTYYEGRWMNDMRHGFGFSSNSEKFRAGEWKNNVFRGERMKYTSERIYGIDISRYQHGKGKKYYPIIWKSLRINNLGRLSNKNASGTVNYPVSFIYIKSTEGVSIRNKHYAADYRQAKRHGYRCGAYHFFSTRTPGAAQAKFFLKHSMFQKGDFPPVLDVEPTHNQIRKMGGADAMFREVRAWMNIVSRRTGVRPILYISQMFVNQYLDKAPDIKKKYNIWIARYGEYKPDVRLVFWQLSPDGRVTGIHGEVDINVFNGYHAQYQGFLQNELIR